MKKAFLIMSMFSFFSCFNNNNKKVENQGDNFYVNKGSYDAVRIPLIKPYELIKLNGSSEWNLNLVEIPGSVSKVNGVSVKGNTIFLHSGESYCNNEKVKESWVVIDVERKVEECFNLQESFEDKNKGSIDFREPDNVYKEFNDKGKIVW